MSEMPKVITANALIEGDVVYRRADGSWSRWLSDAQTFATSERAELALKAAESEPSRVVGVYLMDLQGDAHVPQHFRETFRATGPSNYPHGKQSQAAQR